MSQQSVNLDVLRSVAVSLVVASHLGQVLGKFGYGKIFYDLGLLGYFGVFLFFIHTSLVLMMSLDRLSKTGDAVTARFYIRRAFRIYPLSILTVVVVEIVRIPAFLGSPFAPLSARGWAANLLLVQNLFRLPDAIGPFWSLPFEVQMYLLLPFLYLLARRIRTLNQAVGLVLLGYAVSLVEGFIATALHYHAALTYAPWFCMGVAAYGVGRFAKPSLSPKLLAAALALWAISPWIARKTIASSVVWSKGYVIMSFGVVLALSLPYLREFASPAVKRVSHLIAKYSYGIYLSHVPIIWLAFMKLPFLPFSLQVLVFASLMIAVPVALYHCIEEPFIGWGARIADRLVRTRFQPPKAAAATAAVGGYLHSREPLQND